MITVGAVYMRVSGQIHHDQENEQKSVESKQPTTTIAPTKEIMKDMLEMTRGVQHPTRGLFLRYYMSGLTRDYLPNSKEGYD